MTFTVEVTHPTEVVDSQHTVHIFISPKEIDQLIIDLQSIRNKEHFTSVRLFSDTWGPGHLTENTFFEDSALTHFLRIWKVDE